MAEAKAGGSAVERAGRLLVIDPDGTLMRAVAPAGSQAWQVTATRDTDLTPTDLAEVDPDLVLVALHAESDERDALLDAISRDESRAGWICLLDPDCTLDEVRRVRDAGALDCLVMPVADGLLERTLAHHLRTMAESRENERLRHTIEVMTDCHQLVHALDPGKLYPMALDLLLHHGRRERGLALFRRDTIPASNSVAVRGFADGATREICRLLLEEKTIESNGFDRIEVVARGAFHEVLRDAGVDAGRILLVPVQGEENEVGVLCILEDSLVFGSEEVFRAEIIASHACAALRNAETYAHAKERAFIDDVTEVYNARYLLSTCENEIQRARRYGNPLSVLFLDLDRFKLVNDRYGHLVGSETLRRLSRLLGQCVRQVDTLARYGGDEFTIVLVDTGEEEALRIAERIRRTVEEFDFEIGRDEHLRLTISIGVATCPEHGATRDRLLDSADKAMYRAKSEGRNRVSSASELA